MPVQKKSGNVLKAPRIIVRNMCFNLLMIKRIGMYLPKPEQDVTQGQFLSDVNMFEFSFSQTGCHTKVKAQSTLLFAHS